MKPEQFKICWQAVLEALRICYPGGLTFKQLADRTGYSELDVAVAMSAFRDKVRLVPPFTSADFKYGIREQETKA